MYLVCGTRPNIAFVIGQFSHHNSDPRIDYICIAKQTLRYLKRTCIFGIIWGRNFIGHRDEKGKYGPYGVVSYADSSYVEDINNQKSINRYCIFFGEVITI